MSDEETNNSQNFGLMAYRVDRLFEENAKLIAKVDELEQYIQNRERERANEEKRRMHAAISFLGGLLLTVIGVIWSYRGVIFRGTDQ